MLRSSSASRSFALAARSGCKIDRVVENCGHFWNKLSARGAATAAMAMLECPRMHDSTCPNQCVCLSWWLRFF